MRGSIRPVGKDVWELRLYAGKDPLSGKDIRTSKRFKGKKREAEKELAKLVSAKQDLSTRGTFAEAIKLWLTHVESLDKISPKGMQEMTRIANNVLAVEFGTIQLVKLDAHTIDAAIGKWHKTLSPATIKRRINVLSSAYTQFYKWGWVKDNPCRRLTLPATKTKPMITPAPDLVKLWIDKAVDYPHFATAIMLAALTGARRGELCALRWSDIDLKQKRLTIARSLTWLPRQDYIEGPTKTHQVRTIALDNVAVDLIKTRMAYQTEFAGAFGVKPVDDPFLLSDEPDSGLPLRPDRISTYVRRHCDGFHFHQLRHFAATQMIANGVDPVTAAARLGHADPSVTLKVYSHALELRDRSAAEVTSKALMG